MFAFSKRLSVTCGAGLALLTAACSGGEGPTASTPVKLSSPEAIPAQLQAVGVSFNSQAYESFTWLSWSFHTTSAFVRAGALVGASRPVAPSELARLWRPPQLHSLQQVHALRALLAPTASAATAAIFPPEALGKTYVWDPGTGGYVLSDRLGAPADGVRFVLYTIDVQSGLPNVEDEVGYADLIDVSPAGGGTTALRIVVMGTKGPTPVTYLDYTVSVTTTATAVTIHVTGSITDGTTQLTFTSTLTATLSGSTITSLTIDVACDVNAQDAHLRLILGLSETSLTIDFTFRHAGEVITLTGTLTETNGTVSGTLTVKVNGATFATCQTDLDGLEGDCQSASGPLSTTEQQALEALSDAALGNAVFGSLFDLVDPALDIMGFSGF